MRKHASDGSPEDSGGGTIVDKGSAWVGKESFSEEFREFDFISEERAGDVDSLAPDNCNSLS